MTQPGRIELKAEADISDARRELLRLQAEVRQLDATLDDARRSEIEVNIGDALRQLGRLESEVKSFDQQTDQARTIQFEAKTATALRDVRSLVRESTRELDRLRRAADANPFDALSRYARDVTVEMVREFQRLEREFTGALRKLERESRRANFDPAGRSARRLRENVRLAAEDVTRFANRVPRALRQAGTGFDIVEQKSAEARRALALFQQEANQTGRSTSNLQRALGSVSTAFSAFTTAFNVFAASIVVDRLLDLGRSFARVAGDSVQAAADIELLRARLEGLYGSTERADAVLAELRQTAFDLALPFEGLVQEYTKFTAAAEAVGFTLPQQKVLFEGLAIALRGAGVAGSEADLAFKAVNDILTKTKVEAEELTGQLGERVPGALGILADKLGVSTQELRKLSEQGELLAQDVVPALVEGLLERFGPAASEAADTASADFERFRQLIQRTKETLGAELLPEVRALLREFVALGGEGGPALELLSTALRGLLISLTDVLKAGGDLLRLDFGTFALEARAAFLTLKRVVNEALTEILANLLELEAKILIPFSGILEGLAGQLRELNEQADRELKETADALSARAEEIRRANREGADDALAAWDNAAGSVQDRWQSTLDGLREQFGDTRRRADAEAKGTAKAWTDAASSIARAFAEVANATSTAPPRPADPAPRPSTSTSVRDSGFDDYGRQLDDARGKVEALRQEQERLSRQEILSQADLDRLGDLPGLIGQAQNALRDLELDAPAPDLAGPLEDELAASVDVLRNQGAAVQDAIRGLVDSDAFRRGFAELPDATREALRSVLAEIDEAAGVARRSAGEVNENMVGLADGFEGFVRRQLGEAARLFADGGSAADGFADRVTGALGGVDHASRSVRDSLGGVGESLMGMTQAAANGVDNVIRKGDEMAVKIPAAAEAAKGGWIQFGDETVKLGDAAQQTGDQVSRAGDQVKAAGNQGQQAAAGIGKAKTAAEELGQTRVDPAAGQSVEDLGKAGEKAADGLGRAKDPLDQVTARADAASLSLGRVNRDLDEGGRAADGLASSAESLAQGLRSLSEAGGAADILTQIAQAAVQGAEPLTTVANGLERSATASTALGEDGGTGAEILTSYAEAAIQGAEPFTTLADGLERTATATTTLGEAQAGAEVLTTYGEAAATAADPLGQAADASERLSTATTETTSALEGAPALVESWTSALSSAKAPLQSLGDAASTSADHVGELNTATEDAATSQEQLATHLETSAEQAGELSAQASNAATNVAELGTQTSDAAGELQSLLDLLKQANPELQTYAANLAQAAANAGQLADNLNRAAEAASEVNEEITV